MSDEEKKSTEVTGCNTCKKGLNNTQRWLIVFSIYLLITSIYGNVALIKDIISLFK
jgi:hypothetical protein